MSSASLADTRHHVRLLHLGFEDPAMPGAGGGSVRTHEVNRRLVSQGFDITVLTTGYPGSKERVQDGVRYVPLALGASGSRLTRLLGYVMRLPIEVRRHNVDLVVEDFFAPFSSMGAPAWTGRPTVGMVQWLHARAKSQEYRLPFHWLERAGVRRHRRLIAVSEGTAAKLRTLNPAAHVDVIGNGVTPEAFATQLRIGRDVVFVGRLELGPKGLDLLLEAWARASRLIPGSLIIAGSGPDEDGVRRMVRRLALEDRVRMVGWVAGREKVEIVGGARLAVVPSRHETFGMVALEALACGTPVVCFRIAGLDEVIGSDRGRLVEPFDVQAFADALVAAYGDEDWLSRAAARGRVVASEHSWDEIARRQAAAYRSALDDRAALADVLVK